MGFVVDFADGLSRGEGFFCFEGHVEVSSWVGNL